MIQQATFLLLLAAQTALGQSPREEDRVSMYSEFNSAYTALKEDARSQVNEGKTIVTATYTHAPANIKTWPYPSTTVITATPGWDANWPHYQQAFDREYATQSGTGFEPSNVAIPPSICTPTSHPHSHSHSHSHGHGDFHECYVSDNEAEGVEADSANKRPHFNGSAANLWGRWVAPFYLGTPPVGLRVMLNTGSNDFWVYPAGKGWALTGYNASNSSTHVLHTGQTFKSSDQGGTVSGTVVTDTVYVGAEYLDLEEPDFTKSLPNCTFGIPSKANHISTLIDSELWDLVVNFDHASNSDGAPEVGDESKQAARLYVDGMLGLGMARLDDKSPTKFLPWLARTQNITLFTLALRGKDSDNGYFGFGSIDRRYLSGTISYTPAHRVSYKGFEPAWGITITSFEVVQANQAPIETNLQVVVDSGSEYILLPKELVEEYYFHVKGAAYNETQKQWCLPCGARQMPEVQFGLKVGYVGKLSHQDFEEHIPVWRPHEYEEPDAYDEDTYKDPSVCAGRVQQVEKGGHAVFGSPFFTSRFLVFDLRGEKIGIAKAKDPDSDYPIMGDEEEDSSM